MKWSEMTKAELYQHITSIKGPAYYAPKAAPDYSPRDKRVFLAACRDRNCPADRCLEMRDDG